MIGNQIRYAFLKYPVISWLATLITLLAFVLCIYDPAIYQKVDWSEPILGGLAFIFSLMVFINQMRIEWESNLPKRIDVYFNYEGRTVMKMENGSIPEGTDLRAWAQQIGAQMGKTRKLQFLPSVEMAKPVIQKDKRIKEVYKLYPVTYILTELPQFDLYEISRNEEPDGDKRKEEEAKWRTARQEYLKKDMIFWHAYTDERGVNHVDKSPKD